jgi:hypothetical protein
VAAAAVVRSEGVTLCACILEPVLVYFLGVLGVLTIPDRQRVDRRLRPDPQTINQSSINIPVSGTRGDKV